MPGIVSQVAKLNNARHCLSSCKGKYCQALSLNFQDSSPAQNEINCILKLTNFLVLTSSIHFGSQAVYIGDCHRRLGSFLTPLWEPKTCLTWGRTIERLFAGVATLGIADKVYLLDLLLLLMCLWLHSPSGFRSPVGWDFDMTLRHTTVGRIHLDEGSARRRDL